MTSMREVVNPVVIFRRASVAVPAVTGICGGHVAVKRAVMPDLDASAHAVIQKQLREQTSSIRQHDRKMASQCSTLLKRMYLCM